MRILPWMMRKRPLRPVSTPERQQTEATPRRHFVAEWTLQILILLFGYTTLGWTYVVPTGSMENTLLVGDHLIVDHLVYSPAGKWTSKLLPYSDISRGDIVVFKYPLDPKQNYVKRVIGMPGDRLRIRDKQVFVNGRPLHEPYKRLIPQQSSAYLNDFPRRPDVMIDTRAQRMLLEDVKDEELVVPPGQYFVMGDNRDNSADSRFWGFVPRGSIVGKPVLVFWSYDANTQQLSGRSYWLDAAVHFFSKTRWSRCMRLVRG